MISDDGDYVVFSLSKSITVRFNPELELRNFAGI